MPRSTFDRRLDVSATPQEAWAVLTDVPRLVDWVDIVEDAHEIERLSRYSAILRDRMGPFKLRADLDIRVNEVDVEKYIALSAEGEDRQVGARLRVEASMELDSSVPDGTSVHVNGVYEVTGKVASMGSGSINKKAERILDNFFSHAGESLGAR